MKEKAKLGTESYKGVRDFYPEDQAIQNHMFKVLREVSESFGYVEYGASILEPAELYRAKSGDEIVNEQTYTFIDRGDREVTLRPEMTPTVARMVAARKRDLSFPLRWYSIPNLFRYERPQKGRLREHWQLNVDLFGLEGIEADAEVISVAYNILRKLGLTPDQFEIKINSRKLLDEQASTLNLDEDKKKALRLLIDKKNKMTEEDFKTALRDLVGSDFKLSSKPSGDVLAVQELLKKFGITNTTFDPSIVRGFDYYTGIVFEVFDTNPENRRAILGGGRYDDLLGIFGGERVPAVGFGFGDVMIREVLESYNLLPSYMSSTNLYIIPLNEACIEGATLLATTLRDQGLAVAVDYSGKKISDGFKKADRDGIPFAFVLGEEEISSGEYKIKELATTTETKLTADAIPTFIKEKCAK
jgi:histidyl-tRNA synthetase